MEPFTIFLLSVLALAALMLAVGGVLLELGFCDEPGTPQRPRRRRHRMNPYDAAGWSVR